MAACRSATSGIGTRTLGAAGPPRGTTSTRLAAGAMVRAWARNSAAGAAAIVEEAITTATGRPAAAAPAGGPGPLRGRLR